jgi:hypothetical protein
LVFDNSEDEEDWEPASLDAGSCRNDNGLSDRASEASEEEGEAASLLWELGEYPHGPWPDEDFAVKYREENWHAKTYEMHPRHAFCGPQPGPKHGIQDFQMAPVDYFKLLWTEAIQTRIVRKSNRYARSIDPRIGVAVEGRRQVKPISTAEFCKWTRIVILMGVQHQLCMQDYWQCADEVLYCKDIASTMSRDHFEHIKRCLHLVDNSTYVTNKRDPHWDPLGKTRWFLNELIISFNKHMSPSPYLCVDESMIAYNDRYCGFKQYQPAKPITHGIKVFVMCCVVTRYILNWEVYVGTGVNPAMVHHREGGEVQ